MWEQLFGIGMAETLEDLGTQGIRTHTPGIVGLFILENDE